MNRVSVRGIGFAAVSMAATGAVWGGLGPALASPVSPPGTLSAAAAMAAAITSGPINRTADSAALHAVRLAEVRAAVAHGAAVAHQSALRHRSQVAAANAAARRRIAAQRAFRAQWRPVQVGSVRALGVQLAARRGWTGAQFMCLDDIWTRESNWRVNARNPVSGAYGIPQARPGVKMSSVASDWLTNPVTQIEWGLGYIAASYGNPCNAWSFWQNHYWY